MSNFNHDSNWWDAKQKHRFVTNPVVRRTKLYRKLVNLSLILLKNKIVDNQSICRNHSCRMCEKEGKWTQELLKFSLLLLQYQR